MIFLESMILLHHLAATFKKSYLHASPVISFEFGVTLVPLNKKERGKDVFGFFESQNIVFRIQIMQIEIKFSFQKYITQCSLI